MVEDAQVWHQMPQIILQFPYSGVDFCDDPEMILPPGEVFDCRGMMLFLLVFDDVFVYVVVGSRGQKVELIRAPTFQGTVKPSWVELRAGERQRREDARMRPSDEDRVARRHRYDDPGAGPSHAPPAKDGGEFDDFYLQLEVVLQGMHEGMWVQIQDEGILDQCIGLSAESRTLIYRAVVTRAVMTG
jgi:hypothetical protein